MPRATASNCSRCVGVARWAPARQNGDQAFPGESLQGLADWRTPEAIGGGEHLLGKNVARPQAKRDDLLLDDAVCLLGQRLQRLPGFTRFASRTRGITQRCLSVFRDT